MKLLIKLCIVLLPFIYPSALKSQNYYKVTYTGSMLSGSVSNKLSKELPDPLTRKAFAELIAQYKVQYALYIDRKKNISLFRQEKEEALDGPPPFKYMYALVNENSFYLEDLFRTSLFKVNDKNDKLVWQITNEIQKIGAYTCKKAILKSDPYHTTAWFTEDMPLSFGPSICFGLPGLVVMCENDYFACTIDKIAVITPPKDVLSKMNAVPAQKNMTMSDYYKKVTPLLKNMANERIIND